MTAKRAGSGWRSQAQARWLRVSSVEPDLDAATCRVRAGSSSAPSRAMAAGSVVSRTVRVGAAGSVAPERATTSGNRLDPPMPASSTWSTPSARRAVRAPRVSRRAAMSGPTVSQPRRSEISVGSSRQSVWSPAQVRATASRSASSPRAAAVPSARGPRRSGVSSRITSSLAISRGAKAHRQGGELPTVRPRATTVVRLMASTVPETAQAPSPAPATAEAAPGLSDRALVAITAVVALPLVWLGYGTDIDIANVLHSGALIRAGDYAPSRNPGVPVVEAIVGVLDPVGGHLLVNLATAAALAFAVVGV